MGIAVERACRGGHLPHRHTETAAHRRRPRGRLPRRPVTGRSKGVRMKLAVIGGGSTYTPELIDGIARLADQLKVTELVLVDPDETRLPEVGPFSARISRRHRHPARGRATA